ncbi:MAG: 50S ribosomal protein L32 [Desulfobacterales bacterium]|jgi:large subunit ribosomal protein L32|nr:50S ribosomal protein L32 [Desulfobacterales bacterium]
MGLPKRRVSKSRRDKRRTGKRLTAPSLSTCADCGEPAMPHRACPSCGSYRGRQVVKTDAE